MCISIKTCRECSSPICNANGLQELPESESELGVPLRTCELERVGTLAASVFFSRLVSKNGLLKKKSLWL